MATGWEMDAWVERSFLRQKTGTRLQSRLMRVNHMKLFVTLLIFQEEHRSQTGPNLLLTTDD